MLLRIAFVTFVFICIVIPLYQFLKRRTIRLKVELEDQGLDDKLAEIKSKTKQLKADCKEQEQEAERRAKDARKTQNKL